MGVIRLWFVPGGDGIEYQGRKTRVNSMDTNFVIAGEGPDVLLAPVSGELVIPGARRIAGAAGVVNLPVVSWIRAARRSKAR